MSGSEQVQSVEVEKTVSPSLPPAAAAASSSSCRKKKSDTTSTTFFGDVVDHIDEFVHASMDEHKDCLKKTLNKVNLHVFVYVCMYVCVFLWLEEVHLLQRVHVAVCCCYLFFPLRVITRHDKNVFCGAGIFGRLLLLFVDSFVHSEGGKKRRKSLYERCFLCKFASLRSIFFRGSKFLAGVCANGKRFSKELFVAVELAGS